MFPARQNVKWLTHIQLTNDYRISDTYAVIDDIGNDPVSILKTYANVEGADITKKGREREGTLQRTFARGESVLLSGVVMRGRTPPARVEYWVRKVEDNSAPSTLADDDPELLSANWRPAEIEPPPEDWSCALPEGVRPSSVFAFDHDGRPESWPLPFSYANWSVRLDLDEGHYELRARSVDVNGYAQPEPRSAQKSGRCSIGCRRVSIL